MFNFDGDKSMELQFNQCIFCNNLHIGKKYTLRREVSFPRRNLTLSVKV